MRWRVETLIAAGFGVALLILLVVSNVSYKTTNDFIDFIEITRRVMATYQVINKLEGVLSLLKDIETGVSSYAITGDERFLKSYQLAASPLQEAIEELRKLTADSPRQLERLVAVEPLISSRLNSVKKIIESRKEQRYASAAQLVTGEEGKLVMDRIRQIIGDMIREEQTRLAERDHAARASAQTTLRTIATGSLLAVIIVALASVLIYGRIKERRRAEEALRRAHDELEMRVHDRTGELAKVNADLQAQVGERLKAEEARRESEARLRQIIDLAPVYIYAKDRQGRFILANRLTAEAFSRVPAEVEGKTDEELNLPAAGSDTLQADLEILAGNKVEINPEEVITLKPGVTRVLQTARIPFTTLGSREPAVLVVSIDITERILAERKLRENEASLAAAQRIAHLGSWELDLDSATGVQENVARLSDEAFHIFGREPGEVEFTSKSLFLSVHPDDRAAVAAAVAEAIRERTKYSLDHRIVTPDGTERYVHAESDVVYDETGRPLRMMGTLQDITERKQAEQEIRKLNEELEQRVRERTAQLESAVRELEAFSYSVSHDLRAPLRAIDGFSHLLLEDYGNGLDDKAQSHLGRIRAATQRMGAIIDDLLRLSRVTRADLKPRHLSLSDMAEEIIGELRGEQAERAVRFTVSPGLEATADPNLMRIVLENLLRNAWKFTSKHPEAHIEFAGETRNGEKVFYVRDDGAGFDMTFVGKLFRAFERLHGAKEFEGTGIGLAIVQRIIQRHGGRLWAEGAIEKGATFFFTLPA